MKKGIVYVLIAAGLWGCIPVIASFIYARGVTSLETAAIRSYMAGIIYIGIAVHSRHQLSAVKLKHIPFYACYGLCAITCLYVFYLTAIDLVSGSVACTLMYTAPAFVILFSRLIYKEKITKRKILGIIITFLGCALVVKLYDTQELAVNGKGILFGILSGLSYSSLTLFGRKGIEMYPSGVNTILIALFGAFFMFFVVPPWKIPVSSLSLIFLYILLGLVGSVLPYVFYMKGLQAGLEGGNASIIATFEPVAATILGVLILGDHLAPAQGLGILLVVVGATLPLIQRKKKVLLDTE